ncbi:MULTISPECIES: TIGR02530 family flagellar biosynthesis protein [unclassified Sedimentibacter]|uniref:TIGR02530 family flagellar biosynthesis protein n=1 Tax=unclassified Sedimentibacter TaxID=2649220 RepID=UPI0027E1CBFF|nr:TIGR02530 family flagellar biosynthesis protein [Sedimentibacter sp. MB35-C1]WMJ78602.1 TIGR02530 family flagellar biosynthesis protein [Sedimentibacter sp. MB35-C1]
MTDVNFIRKISNLNSMQTSSAVKNKEHIDSVFKEVLNQKINNEKTESGVVFSKHANERIRERSIDVSTDVTVKLNEAADQAKEKGLKNVLVMIENQAFIVSTISNKVITAVNSEDLKENIFTNIDGAVIK